MSRIKRARPSPALVISIVAMFAALGGGAFAATATTSKDAVNKNGNLNKNVVKKKNIAKNAVVTGKIKNGKVTGSKLSDESVSASKLGSITEVTETSPPAQAPAITATATCPEGSQVVAGGYSTNPPYDEANVGPVVHKSERSNNGWKADATAVDTGDTVTAKAYCLSG